MNLLEYNVWSPYGNALGPGIATRWGLDGSEFEAKWGQDIFLFSKSIQRGCGAYPASSTNGTVVLTHEESCRDVVSKPLCVSTAYYGETFTFTVLATHTMQSVRLVPNNGRINGLHLPWAYWY